MLPLAAYADRLSVRPGQTITFKVANAGAGPVSARLVRVICADANPAGPGIQLESIDAAVTEIAQPGPCEVPAGSYAVVNGADRFFAGPSFTLACRVFPTHVNGRRQALVARLDTRRHLGVGLIMEEDGRLGALMGDGATLEGPTTSRRLSIRRWHVAWLRFDATTRKLEVGHAPVGIDASDGRTADSTACEVRDAASPAADGPLLFAAANHAAPEALFNGKLERPMLWDRALSQDEMEQLVSGEEPTGAAAIWDFADGSRGSRITDAGPNA
ncbi:MAG: LamG-like jellyroll fold domain-containing protein, partial [Gammaproteobacteria bacterium]